MRRISYLAAIFCIAGFAYADGPADNDPNKVRPVPAPGIKVPADTFTELKKGVVELGKEIESLRQDLAKKPALLELLPDVQIFYNSVYYALKYDEFYSDKEFDVARKHLQQGHERAKNLREGKAPWNIATGLVVRGYQSKIDGSIQPYGLVIPPQYKAGSAHHRLDIWFHGRGEKLTELNFIEGRSKDPGQFTPPYGMVLHPYGRYCNANHFAGEIDTFEAIAHARKHYPIDVNRISVRGFSMGGAACWNFAVHYPGLWAAAAPGAGFSETPEFLRVFQKETLKPNWWEKKLLHWYDCTDWAENLYNLPTVAYSGEIDNQKQAADIMATAMREQNVNPLVHIIGPKTGHAYHPEAKTEINRRIDSIVAFGRDPLPKEIRFTTYTLRYNSMSWLTVDALKEHWVWGRMSARIRGDGNIDVVVGDNITAFTLAMPPGQRHFRDDPLVIIHQGAGAGNPIRAALQSDHSWAVHFRLIDGKWQTVSNADDGKLAKRHGLQGPIDDAFMSTFVMVKPTGKPMNDKVGKWIDSEMNHAFDHWRKQFRGEIKPIDDTAVDDKWVANANLILWGDPQSNKVLAKIADKLPIKWDDSKPHVPVLIYPNPLNPKKYVVLNSGFTFREYDYLNNARQIPRLPDWAILDIDQPRTSQRPAGIVDAGFFDERWQLPSKQ